MKLAHLILAAVAATLPVSCVSTGNLQISGDLTSIGIPATFSYSGGKNPITSGK